MSLPPLPPGAVLDEEDGLPPLPLGAVLDVEQPPLRAPSSEEIDQNVTPDLKHGQFGSPLGRQNAKIKTLEGALTFFGNGGPASIMRGSQAALQWPGGGGPLAARKGEGPVDLYRRIRDSTDRDLTTAEEHGPQVEVGGMKINPIALAGSAAPAVLAGNPTGLMARLGLGGFLGSTGAAMRSRADLTRGEVVPLLKDVGKGALFGVGATGVAEGLSAPLRGLAAGAGKQAGLAADEVVLQGQKAADKAVKSASGVLGGVTAGGSNTDEYVIHVLSNPSKFSAQVVRQAEAVAADPASQAIRDGIARANMQKFGEFLPRHAEATAALNDARAFADPAAVAARAAAKMNPAAVERDVAGKVWSSIGQRAVLGAAGAGVGAAADSVLGIDDHKGGMGGAAMGVLMGPGALQMMRNQVASPVVQNYANNAAQRGFNAAISGVAGTGRGAAALEPKGKQEIDKATEAAIQAFLTGG